MTDKHEAQAKIAELIVQARSLIKEAEVLACEHDLHFAIELYGSNDFNGRNGEWEDPAWQSSSYNC